MRKPSVLTETRLRHVPLKCYFSIIATFKSCLSSKISQLFGYIFFFLSLNFCCAESIYYDFNVEYFDK